MKINNKVIMLLFCLPIIGGLAWPTSVTKVDEHTNDDVVDMEEVKVRIASCPTGYELIKDLGGDIYEVVQTASTSESLSMLTNGQADLVLAGRTLKPTEPSLGVRVIRDGYAVLGDREKTIYIDQLRDNVVYTDHESDEVKNVFDVDQVERVDDVYGYVNKYVVITDWDKVDYTKAGLIHVLNESGQRVLDSRRMALYYDEKDVETANKVADLIKNLVKDR